MIKKPKLIIVSGITYIFIVLGMTFVVYSSYCRFKETRFDAQKKEIVYEMYADYKKDFPDVVDITANDAMALIKAEKAVFVDTRKQREMEDRRQDERRREKERKREQEDHQREERRREEEQRREKDS